MKKTDIRTLGTTSALALVLIATAGTATGAQAQGISGSEDIVVTARKRDEDIQRVPIAITALTADDLNARNISNFNDLANATPGVSITSIAGGTAQNIYIRGLAPANTANDLNVEANVGVFIDGIYQTSRNTLDIISVLDVGQIEIAKGPQSALFGRSTFAGALSISTRAPAKDFEFNGQATAGTDKDFRIRGSISAPLTETLSVRVGGGYLTYDGFGENLANPDDNLGGTEKYAFTGSVLFTPTDELTLKLAGFITHSKSELSPASLLPLTDFNCGNVNAATGLPVLYCGTLHAPKVSNLTPNLPDTVSKTRQVSLDFNWTRDGISFSSVTGFTAAENDTYNDYGGSANGTLFGVCTGGAACVPAGAYTRLVRANILSASREKVRTFSQELRLQSDNSSPFQWIVGGSFFDSRIPLSAGGIGVSAPGLAQNDRLVQVRPIGTVPPTGVGAYDFTANPFLIRSGEEIAKFSTFTESSTRTFSIFGALGYQFGDLRVNAEGRYNTDRKRAQTHSVSNPLSQPGINQPINGLEIPSYSAFPVAGRQFARSFASFAPRFTVDYQATQDIFLYASAAKGVRSGGFNTANAVGPQGILEDEVSYEEETNWTYEAGFKAQFFDRQWTLNATAFHVDWTNAQVSAFTLNPTAVNPVRIVRNAGDIKSTGFEVQTDVRLGEMFNVGGSVVYSNPKFQAGAYEGSQIAQCVVGTGASATAAPGCPPVTLITTATGAQLAVPSLEGNSPQRAVKLQWNAHAQANVPINNDWTLDGRVDVTHSGEYFSNQINTTAMGKRTLTNLRVGVSNDRFNIAVWANNLFNVNYAANSINQPRAGVPFTFSVPEIYLGETRRIGITASFNY